MSLRLIPFLTDDPLGDYTKSQLLNYARETLTLEGSQKTIFDGVKGDQKTSLLRLATKTYVSPHDKEKFEKLRELFEAKCPGKLAALQKTLLNPSENPAFGLANPRQIFAAQKFLKAAILEAENHFDVIAVHSRYCEKMSSYQPDENPFRTLLLEISEKNKLLLGNCPLKRMKNRLTPINVLLSHTYFSSSQTSRRHLKQGLVKLATHVETKHVINALAVLILKEKGNIFISAKKYSIAKIAYPYLQSCQNTTFKTIGFYNAKHSIFIPNFIDPSTGEVVPKHIAVFIHESLHFLFCRLVSPSTADPTQPGTRNEKWLDSALTLDRENRKMLCNEKTLSHGQKIVLEAFRYLDQPGAYFLNGYNSSNPNDRMLDRIESIVRVMQLVTMGISHETIRSVTPHLYVFYFVQCKPMLEHYYEENNHLFHSK